MPRYIALIHKDAKSDFGVSFPDFPGCVSAGRDLAEAQHMAQEALQFHVDGLLEEGGELPPVSSLDTIMSKRSNRGAVCCLVEVKAEEPRAVRINVTLREDLLRRLDAEAARSHMTRSALLAYAVRQELERRSAG